MTFDEWLDKIFTEHKGDPGYEVNANALRYGNLRKAWDAGMDEGIRMMIEGGVAACNLSKDSTTGKVKEGDKVDIQGIFKRHGDLIRTL